MRVITFSRQFPANHPKKGQPTFFVEKIWKSLYSQDLFYNMSSYEGAYNEKFPCKFTPEENIHNYKPKNHTIRVGNRWKEGQQFSPRVWSGKPYQSKQITFAPDIEIKKIWKFECKEDGTFYLNNIWIDFTSSSIPTNDGLTPDELLDWFPKNKPFIGQVICWNESINY